MQRTLVYVISLTDTVAIQNIAPFFNPIHYELIEVPSVSSSSSSSSSGSVNTTTQNNEESIGGLRLIDELETSLASSSFIQPSTQPSTQSFLQPLSQSYPNKTLSPELHRLEPQPIVLMPNLTPSQSQSLVEWRSIIRALLDSRQRDSEAYVITIFDSSVSTANQITVNSVIQSAKQRDFDLMYLTKWLDRCSLYSDKQPIEGEGIIPNTNFTFRSYQPSGLQAIMYSPHGRDIVLGLAPMRNGELFKVSDGLSYSLTSEINRRNIVAYCVVPNLFNFNLALAPTQTWKLNECQEAYEFVNDTFNLLWFIIIVVVILILAWAIIRISPE